MNLKIWKNLEFQEWDHSSCCIISEHLIFSSKFSSFSYAFFSIFIKFIHSKRNTAGWKWRIFYKKVFFLFLLYFWLKNFRTINGDSFNFLWLGDWGGWPAPVYNTPIQAPWTKFLWWTEFCPNIKSHAGGWSLWSRKAVKSIFWETISLNRPHILRY